MNVRISPPQLPINDPGVALECEQAIDGAVRELIDHAIVAGWPPVGRRRRHLRRSSAPRNVRQWPITKIPTQQTTRSKGAQ